MSRDNASKAARKLNATEMMVLELLQEKERTFQERQAERITAFSREVEERLGLAQGAIGTRYVIDASGEVREAAKEPEEPGG